MRLDVRVLSVSHCAATKPDMDIGAAEITRWHKAKGYFTIGYHYVIRRNGKIENGRPIEQPGAHAQGHNAESIGICMAGGIDENGKPQCNYTAAQWMMMVLMFRMSEYLLYCRDFCFVGWLIKPCLRYPFSGVDESVLYAPRFICGA